MAQMLDGEGLVLTNRHIVGGDRPEDGGGQDDPRRVCGVLEANTVRGSDAPAEEITLVLRRDRYCQLNSAKIRLT